MRGANQRTGRIPVTGLGIVQFQERFADPWPRSTTRFVRATVASGKVRERPGNVVVRANIGTAPSGSR